MRSIGIGLIIIGVITVIIGAANIEHNGEGKLIAGIFAAIIGVGMVGRANRKEKEKDEFEKWNNK